MPVSYLKGVTNYGDPSNIESLRTSTLMWLDFNFLSIGAFNNIRIPTSGNHGGEFSTLRCVTDPRYTAGKVWESPRSNWVWESGTTISEPIQISGVYLNGTFQSSGFRINYPAGQIIFDTAIPSSSVVKVEHSIKRIKFVDANDVPFFRKIQNESRIDKLVNNSGEWAPLAESRLQFPLVALETTTQATFKGFEIGNDKLNGTISIFAHVVGESIKEVERISEIIANQKDTKYYLMDEKLMAASGKIVLDYNGSKTSTTSTYPEIVAENSVYRGREAYITNSHIEQTQVLAPELYKKSVKFQVDVIF